MRETLTFVLPSVEDECTDGVAQYRLVANFKKPAENEQEWQLDQYEIHRLESDYLARLLRSPETTVLTKILFANWIVESQPGMALQALVDAAQSLEEGQRLATCLRLLVRLEGEGLEEHALHLLREEKTPNGIRSVGALYLGTLKYAPALKCAPALKHLLEAAESQDDVVAIATTITSGSKTHQTSKDC